MDKWAPDQLERMKHGGNAKLLAFFESQPDYRPDMSIREKYTSRFADLYRDKLAAECEGREWTPPANVSLSSSPASSTGQPKITKSLSTVQQARSSTTSPSRQHERSSSGTIHRSASTSAATRPMSMHGSSPSSNLLSDDGTGDDLDDPRSRKDAYFSRLQRENEIRPDHVPPNQGGKYTGFGNPAFENTTRNTNTSQGFDTDDLINDPLGSLSKGWSFFSSRATSVLSVAAAQMAEGAKIAAEKAGEFGQTFNESVVQPTRDTVQDPEFSNKVSGFVSTFGSAVATTGQRGFGLLSDAVIMWQQLLVPLHRQVMVHRMVIDRLTILNHHHRLWEDMTKTKRIY
ncbi:hypothetical protein BDF22DRAFT_519099 [Syncephalis plumigaleata]|nr:hypothetical protein BDF22DRAFT_519099 [Syncephalis plumigaleata]